MEGETSLLIALRPELVNLEMMFETSRALSADYASQPAHLQRRQVTPHKYIGVLTAASDGSNDPELANTERGQTLLGTISARLAARALSLLSGNS